MSDGLGLFLGQDKPTKETVWAMYTEAQSFNTSINLNETVKANRNFFVGKQWEGVNANGLPTPVVNILKRIVGFVTSTIASENIHLNASPLMAYPGDDELVEPARIVNEEFEAIVERNQLPRLIREFTENTAVDGDGCLHAFWDAKAETGQKGVKGQIRTESVENNRVHFGNPNDNDVQAQPWIIIARRMTVRAARLEAKRNGIGEWDQITGDDTEGEEAVDSAKKVFDKVTCLRIYWRDDDTGEIWGFETTRESVVRKPWSLGIRLYPLIWLNWDRVADCYHGQALITGLIPNQIFINKALAMSMVSMMRSAWPKVLYDRTRIGGWDNRVGAAIGVAGSVDGAAKIMDGSTIPPQIAQYIQMVIEETQESLGATAAALGEGKAYNTSAILSLQRAAQTPTEMTKQNLYCQIEDLGRIWLEFMAAYYDKRLVDTETPEKINEAYQFLNENTDPMLPPGEPQEAPKRIQMEFDFSILKDHPMTLKLDVGASSYYSEMASSQTLDNLLMNGFINVVQYLERVPDDRIAGRRKLIDELKAQMEQQQLQAQVAQGMADAGMVAPTPDAAAEAAEVQEAPEAQTGYTQLQRAMDAISQ